MARSPAALTQNAAPAAAPLAPPAPVEAPAGPFEMKPEFDPYFDAPVEGVVDRGDSLEPLDVTVDDPPAAPVADPVTDPAADPVDDVVETGDRPATPAIPKPRFDEVNEQRKKLALENEELRRRLAAAEHPAAPAEPAAPAYDFAAKEKEYMEAVLDGNTEKALQVRNEIRTAERAEIEQQVLARQPKVEDTVIATREQMDNDAATRDINARFPVFDPASEAFNPELTQEAVAIAVGYINNMGLSYPEAANKAAAIMSRMYGFEPVGALPAAAPSPAAPTPEQVKSKVQRAAEQPPAQRAPVATDIDPDPNDLSDEEFDKLPASVKTRLRGDHL